MLLPLFFVFTKIGLFTIGGGYAVIPLIEKEIVQKKWITSQEFYELLAITESLPGVFATNIAALVGFKIGGIKAGILAAFGTILAPFIIIIVLAIGFKEFQDNLYVIKVFKALRPVVVALIAAPCYSVIKINKFGAKDLFFPLIALILMWFFHLSPIWVITGACITGIVYYSIVNSSKTKI